jgi:hypothetical protein
VKDVVIFVTLFLLLIDDLGADDCGVILVVFLVFFVKRFTIVALINSFFDPRSTPLLYFVDNATMNCFVDMVSMSSTPFIISSICDLILASDGTRAIADPIVVVIDVLAVEATDDDIPTFFVLPTLLFFSSTSSSLILSSTTMTSSSLSLSSSASSDDDDDDDASLYVSVERTLVDDRRDLLPVVMIHDVIVQQQLNSFPLSPKSMMPKIMLLAWQCACPQLRRMRRGGR